MINNGGLGGVIQKHIGHWISGFTHFKKEKSAIHMEMIALLDGLKLVIEKNLLSIILEIDSQVLINIL